MTRKTVGPLNHTKGRFVVKRNVGACYVKWSARIKSISRSIFRIQNVGPLKAQRQRVGPISTKIWCEGGVQMVHLLRYTKGWSV